MKEYLKEIFLKYEININEEQCDKFVKYYSLLKEWNEKINLTAITEEKEVVIKHFLDSVLIYKDLKDDESVIDIGAGAGFPGIPLKILFPNLKLTLCDSLNKRVNFLNIVCAELNLNNVQCVHARAEELAHKNNYRESFDVCVARAVARLNVLSEYCLPFVKTGGKFIAYKSVSVDEELLEAKNAITKLGGELLCVKTIQVEETNEVRKNVFIIKTKNCDKKYPRGQNKPRLNPIS